MGVARPAPGPAVEAGFVSAVTHGIGQVMFQASVWTGRLFLVGIAVNSWRHAAWVLAGRFLGTLVGGYHATAAIGGRSTPNAWSSARCPRTSRSGCTATTRRWRPSPCSCGGGR